MKSGKLVDFFKRKKFWGVSGTLKVQPASIFSIILTLWSKVHWTSDIKMNSQADDNETDQTYAVQITRGKIDEVIY